MEVQENQTTQTELAAENLQDLQSQASETENNVTEQPKETKKSKRSEYTREQILKRERDELRQQLAEFQEAKQRILSNGWDIEALKSIKNSTVVEGSDNVNNPLINQLQEQIRYLNEENSRRDQLLADERELKSIYDFIDNNSDEFELIKAYKLESKVQEFIKQEYKTKQKLLSYKEAAEIIEKHMEREEKANIEILAKTKKAKAFFNAVEVKDVKSNKSQGIDAKKIEDIVKISKNNTVQSNVKLSNLNKNDLINSLINKHKKG